MVDGVHDKIIPVANSFILVARLRNAVLLTFPVSGHGSLFQFHDACASQAIAFLASDGVAAPY